jgi:hypothetical protein
VLGRLDAAGEAIADAQSENMSVAEIVGLITA